MDSKELSEWKLRQHVRECYELQSDPKAYDDRSEKDEWQRAVYINAQRIASINDFKTIVDFGCGSGFKLIKYLSEFETIGFEIEPALSFLKSSYPENIWSDGSSIGSGDIKADLVICADVLEHLADPFKLIDIFANSECGLFVLSTPALELLAEKGISPRNGPPENKSHILEWSTVEFSSLLETRMSILSHSIVSLSQATQMVIACKKGFENFYGLPELVCLSK